VPKLKPEELESRRREIVDAARACFLRNGFHQTTTDQICHEAAITPGGLYHYFSGKDEVISAVIQESTRETVRRLSAMIDEPPDVTSAFRQLAQFLFETMRDPDVDNIARLDIEIWAESLKNEKLSAISKESWMLRRGILERFVERGIEEGIYRSDTVDARGFASLMLANLVGLRLGKLLWKDDFDLDGAIRTLFLMHAGRLVNDVQAVTVSAK